MQGFFPSEFEKSESDCPNGILRIPNRHHSKRPTSPTNARTQQEKNHILQDQQPRSDLECNECRKRPRRIRQSQTILQDRLEEDRQYHIRSRTLAAKERHLYDKINLVVTPQLRWQQGVEASTKVIGVLHGRYWSSFQNLILAKNWFSI